MISETKKKKKSLIANEIENSRKGCGCSDF